MGEGTKIEWAHLLFNGDDLSADEVNRYLSRFRTVAGDPLTQEQIVQLLGVKDRKTVYVYRTKGLKGGTLPFVRLCGAAWGVFPVSAFVENVEVVAT